MYGLTIRSVFAFLQRTRRQPFYVWIMFLVWSLFICCFLAGFAIGYDLLPHTPEPSLTKSRPLIDYLYYEIYDLHDGRLWRYSAAFSARQAARYLNGSSWFHPRRPLRGASAPRFNQTPIWKKSRMIE